MILSGNNHHKYAEVGAIIHLSIRPHLHDIIRVSNRIIHLVFNKKGGKTRVMGLYAPHSGLDFEEVRQPFRDQPEEYTSKVPQPEPVYITGDFNVIPCYFCVCPDFSDAEQEKETFYKQLQERCNRRRSGEELVILMHGLALVTLRG